MIYLIMIIKIPYIIIKRWSTVVGKHVNLLENVFLDQERF